MGEHPAAVAVTSGGHHFCGYYDIQPWNGSGTHLLVLQPPFADREPTGHDPCELGVVELESGQYEPVAMTRAWNFQQGCFAHWHPQAPDEVILYNDRLGDRFVCIELDLVSGDRRVLPRPIAAIDREGKWGASLNFNRLAVTRPGYGYSGLPDPFDDVLHPTDDGLWLMNLETGDHFLAVSMADLAAAYPDHDRIRDAKLWFNHTLLSEDGTRVSFLARWIPPGAKRWLTGLFACDLSDGGNLRCVHDYGLVSHYDFAQDGRILAFCNYGQNEWDQPWRFWLLPDGSGDAELVAPDEWTVDGHCSYSPDFAWILNDCYPGGEQRRQRLMIRRCQDGRIFELGAYHEPPEFSGPIRCDLHPKFSRAGTRICFDSTHDGTRQVYVIDVAGIVRG